MTDYEALKALGHSPAKAAEIVLDAKRGDALSQRWIAGAQGMVGDFKRSVELHAAIADTHPKDGDVEQAPLVSGGGAEGNRPKDIGNE